MTETKRSIFSLFPRPFWVANTLEIFERMGWYGFYTVSALYLTGPISEGGLGFSSEDRGIIQGLVTFFVYLFPAVFGALADRYGFRKMFLASFIVIAPSYLLLSIPKTFWGFFAIYFLVAVGHGMFKPVVTATVAKTTNEKTGTMGFGIFYMMVNVGGFLGPIIAGVVRGWDWNYVFYCSAGWIALNFFVCLFFFSEPGERVKKEAQRSLKQVLRGMVEVVGNGRFFVFISGIMVILIMGAKWWPFAMVGKVALFWLVLNFGIDFIFVKQAKMPPAIGVYSPCG